jgi:ABC-type glycerol-3-phosphate transport system substrate-binding protein
MAVALLVVAAAPATAQVKIRFQTWHWNEKPWVNALEEFQKTFNQANPGIEVVRDDSRYPDKESVFIAQSQAKAAADIPHFSYDPSGSSPTGATLDLTPSSRRRGAKYLAQWIPRRGGLQVQGQDLLPAR